MIVLLDAIKACVDVGHEISSFAWILRDQNDWATLVLACKPEAPSKEECVDICALWLLKESREATSALQEKASESAVHVEYVASFSECPSSLHAVRHLPEVDEVLVGFVCLRESLAYRARSTHLCGKRPRNRDDNNCRTQHDDQSKHQNHDGANLDSSCRQRDCVSDTGVPWSVTGGSHTSPLRLASWIQLYTLTHPRDFSSTCLPPQKTTTTAGCDFRQ